MSILRRVLFTCLLFVSLTLQSPTTADIAHATRQVLARYAILVDSKNFGALSEVFTENVAANYSTVDGKIPLKGIPAIQGYLKESLGKVDHQHALTTQYIDIHSRSATVTTYFTASFFGTGNKTGGYVTAHGKYVDELSSQGGTWKIRSRDMDFVGSYIGDLTIFV